MSMSVSNPEQNTINKLPFKITTLKQRNRKVCKPYHSVIQNMVLPDNERG